MTIKRALRIYAWASAFFAVCVAVVLVSLYLSGRAAPMSVLIPRVLALWITLMVAAPLLYLCGRNLIKLMEGK